MKEQDNFDKNTKTLMATFVSDIERKNFRKKYFYIMCPAPVFDNKSRKLKIGFVVYNRKTEKCTSIVYCNLIELTKNNDNLLTTIKKVKKKLQKKIKKEKI